MSKASPIFGNLLSRALVTQVTGVKDKRIASLWAGYGTVTAITAVVQPRDGAPPATSASGTSGNSGTSTAALAPCAQLVLDDAYSRVGAGKPAALSLVVKQVRPPRGSGVGHERKVASYAAEAHFYTHWAPQLLLPPPHHRASHGTGAALPFSPLAIPCPVYIDAQPPHSFTFVLSDLRGEYPVAAGDMSAGELKVALSWLAQLHAAFWEVPSEELKGLWPQGSYWYLDTRQDELRAMPGEWGELKAQASRIDSLLKGMQPNGSFDGAHMTMVHGDFKPANILFSRDKRSPHPPTNILFSRDKRRCAAYDFQYVGRGFGARDIAYLFCSAASDSLLSSSYDSLLDHYHAELVAALGARAAGDGIGASGSERASGSESASGSEGGGGGGGSARSLGEGYTREVLARHVDWALLDFVRFMAGWGIWGAAGWAERRARELLIRGV
ncbi:hypothetical protein FOA52_016072 [Chlamydomonas sp. UWO 241]|nr:hypothetical protein FOA52_016072 [Chlamydomonas sp. UWO 241]